MSSINSINKSIPLVQEIERIELVAEENRSWAQMKFQRKLNNEKQAREKAQEATSDYFDKETKSQNSFENIWQKLYTTSEIDSKAEESILITEEVVQELTNESLNLNPALNKEELDYLLEFYHFDLDFKKDLNDLTDNILTSLEGSEIDLLSNYLSAKELSKPQIYLLFCFLLAELFNARNKRLFLRQLTEWKKKFAAQESGLLFEFFSLQKNPSLKKQIENYNLNEIMNLASNNLHAGDLKQTISLIAKVFDNQFDNIVSMFIKLRAKQLKKIVSQNNTENRAELFELMRLENYLILINSLYLKQNNFYQQLIEWNIGEDGRLGNNCSQALHGTVELCETNFISEFSIEKLYRAWNIEEPNSQLQSKFLLALINYLAHLPIAFFNNEQDKIKKVLTGIRQLIIDNPPIANQSSRTTLNKIFTTPRKLIRYI